MTFLTILEVTEILYSFKLVLEGKTDKEIPESSRLADLPFLRILLAIHQKSREPSFWEVMDSFVLLAYAGFASSRTLLPQLLVCLNFTLEAEDLSFHLSFTNEESDFYELWQQHKKFKTMEMNDA